MNKQNSKLVLSGILIFILSLSPIIINVRANGFSFDIDEFKEIIQLSPDDSWKKPAQNRKNTMCNKLTELQQLITEENFEEAYYKLLHDIKPKLTGLKQNEYGEAWGNGVFKKPWVIFDELRVSFEEECNLILSEINPQSVLDDDQTPPFIIITYEGENYIDDPGVWHVYVEDPESGLDEVIININGFPEIHDINLGGNPSMSYKNLPLHAMVGSNTIMVTATNNDKDFLGDQETISVNEWVTIVNTPVGTNVEVSDEETGVDITFSEITNVGITDVERNVEGPEPPSDYIAISDFYDITTDATFLGAITIAIPYEETQIYRNEQFIRFLHWDPTTGWIDITKDVDIINNVLYGEVLELSKFLIAEIKLEDNEILIIRDNFGVPHVFANTKEGLGFGAGYAIAQDRLWQMDMYRRQANGSLFEFTLGSIENDLNTRCLGYSRQEIHDMFYDWVPTDPNARIKEMMLAFVDGVNEYIEEALEAYTAGDPSLMPIEYTPEVIDWLPVPWTIEDSVAVMVMMANRFGRTGGEELNNIYNLAVLQEEHGNDLGWDMFNDFFPQVDPGAPVTIPSEESEYNAFGDYSNTPNLPNIINLYQEYEEDKKTQEELYESLGLSSKSGSNAWVISPQKSINGNALQVGGLQVRHTIPATFAEVGMHGAGINAVGMMIPSAPFIITGVSEHGAWTMTTGTSDLVDTYIEVLRPENHHQYYYNGGWVDMEHRIERIYVYKRNSYEERDVWRTIHGPIIEWDLDNNICYTQKVPSFKNELAGVEGWMLFQEAKNVVDAEEACKNIDMNNNFLWADRKGDIGYWHTGKFPIKPTTGLDGRPIDDRLPLWGTGKEEWIGLTDSEEMPKSINPEQGYLVNWNNKPKADWSYSEVDWGEVSGATWIRHQLTAQEKFSFEDMKEINRNTGYNHIDGMYFLDFLINAVENDAEIPIEVIDALKAWDHHYNDILEPTWPDQEATYDDPGLTIFEAWFDRIDNEVFDDDLRVAIKSTSSSTLLHVFDGENSKLTLNYDYLNGEDRDAVIARVLKAVLIELAAKYGSSVSTWLTREKLIFFKAIGALPATIIQYSNRGSFNQIVEMQKSSLPYAENILPPGQNGLLILIPPHYSPHAYDQYYLYIDWAYKPVYFKYQMIKDVAESEKFLYYNSI